MLTLLPGPSLLAVTPATITLAVTCREERGRSWGIAEVRQSGGTVPGKFKEGVLKGRKTAPREEGTPGSVQN